MRSVQLIEAGNLGLTDVVWRGHEADSGSAFAIPYLVVSRLNGDRFDRLDFFNPEDERAALDRLLELQADPAVRAAWKQQLDLMAAVNAHDADTVAHLFGPEVGVIDHRPGTTLDRAGLLDLLGRHPRLNLELVDTSGDAAVMSRLHLVGADGQPALTLGQVTALRDGMATRVELFEPDDEPGMRACLARLSARRAVLTPPRPVLGTVLQRHLDEFTQAVNRRAWADAAQSMAADLRVIDRRTLPVFGELDKAAWLQYGQGFVPLAADAVISYVQFAGDDRIGAIEAWWTGHLDEGGGEFTFETKLVIVLGNDGIQRVEYLDANDETSAFERLLALQSDPDVRVAWAPQLEMLAAINRRDWQRLQACYSQDVQVVEHRPGVPRAQPVQSLCSILDAMPEGRAAMQFLQAGRGRAMSRLHLYGYDRAGEEAETEIGQVLVVREGRIAHVELFNPDDEAAMRTSFEQREPDADGGPIARLAQQYFDCLNSRDIDGIRAYYTQDFRLADHRLASPLSGGLSGEDYVATIQAMFAFASDARMKVDHLGELGEVWLGKLAWVGHQSETGGEFEIPMRAVTATRDDKLARIELFDVDAERDALRAMVRLLARTTAEAAPAATDLVRALAEAVINRDWDRVKGCFAPDLETADHRRIRTLGLDRPGGEGFVERVRGLLALAADARPAVEPLAEVDGIAMALIAWSGHLNEGGGPFELCWRGVFGARDDGLVRYELFDEDDETGMLAALARLHAERENPIAQVCRRTNAAFNAAIGRR
jgi:ketosteroid isomerase-like protein